MTGTGAPSTSIARDPDRRTEAKGPACQGRPARGGSPPLSGRRASRSPGAVAESEALGRTEASHRTPAIDITLLTSGTSVPMTTAVMSMHSLSSLTRRRLPAWSPLRAPAPPPGTVRRWGTRKSREVPSPADRGTTDLPPFSFGQAAPHPVLGQLRVVQGPPAAGLGGGASAADAFRQADPTRRLPGRADGEEEFGIGFLAGGGLRPGLHVVRRRPDAGPRHGPGPGQASLGSAARQGSDGAVVRKRSGMDGRTCFLGSSRPVEARIGCLVDDAGQLPGPVSSAHECPVRTDQTYEPEPDTLCRRDRRTGQVHRGRVPF
jgi:hypothetical protein